MKNRTEQEAWDIINSTIPKNNVFPIVYNIEYTDGQLTHYSGGLTKRELFAAMAMQGLLKNTELGFDNELEAIAQASVQWADALIAELNKEK